ncbi:CD2 antigen cytoplasmic tail-binding protein 2 homolog [Thrips palmi]|uniref:CD2 antigen cytoplasmic tail-binding protein 2 homolog n=1 Tax=Thrips palmi TaxID=161013 RepID=A0A6P9A4I2_THRPL|nr:CD2 antigen cytoplasmic tail-binding protein 2 homolog [Thrips palmi]
MSKRTYDEMSSAEILERDLAGDGPKKAEPAIIKNSLDSDEEDDGDEKNYDILADDDIEGQEEGLAVQEGGVHITPFNMHEEMEEGHFDTEGNYHWKKDKEIRDNWLENVEWVNIKNAKTGVEGEESSAADLSEVNPPPESPFDEIGSYKKILEFMKPKETVKRALQRLGGSGSLSASERLRRKKAGLDLGNPGDKQAVTDLSEIANRILSRTGNMDIYQETYEYISQQISTFENKEKIQPTKAVEAELDMYADDFDTKAKEQKVRKEEAAATAESNLKASQEDGEYSKEPEVTWEYKWKKDDDKINGPHNSEQMQKWLDEGHFKGDEWVRKVRTDGESEFYSIKRVDFELYL